MEAKRGQRNTRQKQAILALLRAEPDTHFTAEALVTALQERHTPVGKATVYRYLLHLEAEGLVKKYTLSEGQSACYQYVGGETACREHYHLMCERCGQLMHFESLALQNLLKVLPETAGLVIDGQRTVFYGLCAECAFPKKA